jgi:hypothetical protein
MRKVETAGSFNRRAHEEEHDDDVASFGIKQARSLTGLAGNERYYYPFVVGELNDIITLAGGKLAAVPHWVGKTTPVFATYMEITGASSANGVIRMGIYKGAEEYGWYPKELVADLGTQVATVAQELQFLTNGVELEGGNWYWTAVVQQGTPVTAPNVKGINPYALVNHVGGGYGHASLFSAIFGSANDLHTENGTYTSGVTGALPDPWPLDVTDGHKNDDVNITYSWYTVQFTGLGGE